MRSRCLEVMLSLALFAGFAASAVGEDGGPQVGTEAPEISIAQWVQGGPFTLEQLRNQGKVVVLEFWATWCGPCKRAIPHLIETYKNKKDKGLEILSITDETNAVDKVKEFVQTNGMIYPIGIDPELLGEWGIRGIPHAVVIDSTGVIKWRGNPLSSTELDAAIDEALATANFAKKDAQLKEAKAGLAAARDLLERGDHGQALEGAQKALAAKTGDAELETAARLVAETVEAKAKEALDAARGALESDPANGLAALEQVKAGFPGTAAAKDAAAALENLAGDVEFQDRMTREKNDRAATNLLDEAKAALEAKKWAEAHSRLLKIGASFEATAAAREARVLLAGIESDAEAMNAVKDAEAEKEVTLAMGKAKNYALNNAREKAVKILDEAAKKYDGTSWAAKARELIGKIQRGEIK